MPYSKRRLSFIARYTMLLSAAWPGVVTAQQPAASATVAIAERAVAPRAPTVAELLADGDRAFEARRATDALARYEQALSLAPDRYDVLWRTSRTLIDVGEAEANETKRRAAFTRANELAARAVKANPSDAEGHFHQSRALGRVALSVAPRQRTKYAVEIRETAMRALAIDPDHAGAQHVLGRWHAEIMRLNGFMRSMAKTFLGGRVFDQASWGEAVRLLEGACDQEPNRTIHLLALGQVYRDAGDKVAARRALEAAVRAPLKDPNDDVYKREAERDLRALR